MAEETMNTAQSTQNDTENTSTNGNDTNVETKENAPETTQANPENAKDVNIEKLIQSAVDRAINKIGNENKRLRNQLESVKREKLSDDEVKKLELADKEADIADREAKLAEKENRLFAIKAIKDAGLDDGGNNALELVDFVMSDNEDTTRMRVKAFSELVKKMVAAKVDETFKSNGRNPEKGGSNETNTTNTIAAQVGKVAADRNAAASKVLNHYLGGK